MKLSKTLTLGLGLIFFNAFIANAIADQESKKQTAHQLINMINTTEASVDGFKLGLKPFIEQLRARGYSSEAMAKVDALVDKYAHKFAADPRLVDGLSDMYVELYTEQELEQILAFYQTATGKKFVKILPQVMQKSAQIGMEISASMQQDFSQDLQEILQ